MTTTTKLTCVQFFDRVLRLPLTTGQRAFVAVAVDRRLPRDLRGGVRDAAVEMFGDVDAIPDLAYRTIVAVMGRDSGKTQIGAGIGLFLMMTSSLKGVGPGDLPTVGLVAPTVRTARIAFERAIALVRDNPDLRKRLVGATKTTFVLRRYDGRVAGLEVFAASRGGGALRGPTFIAVVFDEAAQFRAREDAQVNDHDLYSACMPRIRVCSIWLSTPWSQEGLFHSLASENHGAPRSALVAAASTLVMRDHDPATAAAIALETERDDENATREFVLGGIGSFMSSGSALFFEPGSIEDAINDDLILPASPLPGELFGVGADLGLVRDNSAIVVVGAAGPARQHLRIASMLELRPKRDKPLKLGSVIRDFAGVTVAYGAPGFFADGHSRQAAREHAAEHKIWIYDRPEGKNAVFDLHVAVREAFRDRRIAIPRHPRLLAQLRSVTVRPVSGGQWRIVVPRRAGQGHADLVSAFVLGVHAAAKAQRPLTEAERRRRLASLRDKRHHYRAVPEIYGFDLGTGGRRATYEEVEITPIGSGLDGSMFGGFGGSGSLH